MLKEYELNAEDERIIDELDNLCGVVQNKEVLKNMIIYKKLRNKGEVDFGTLFALGTSVENNTTKSDKQTIITKNTQDNHGKDYWN